MSDIVCFQTVAVLLLFACFQVFQQSADPNVAEKQSATHLWETYKKHFGIMTETNLWQRQTVVREKQWLCRVYW